MMLRIFSSALYLAALVTFTTPSNAQPAGICRLDKDRCDFCSFAQGSQLSAAYYPQMGLCITCSEMCPYGRFDGAEDNRLATLIQNEALAATEERLILDIKPHEAEAVATLNANVAAAVLAMAEISAQPNAPLPSTGSMKMAFEHSPSTIRRIILGDFSDSNFRKKPQGNGGMDPVGALTYILVKRNAGSYMDLRYRATGDTSDSAPSDVRVFLKRINGENGGYWRYEGAQLIEKAAK